MRTYLYRCVEGHEFERQGGLDDALANCECGQSARRRPYSGVPFLKGETVAKQIPDPHYKQEAEKRELSQTWGDATRSMEMLRAARVENADGTKSVDMRKMQ